MEKEKSEAIALFRYGLISDFLHTELNRGFLHYLMKEKSRKQYRVFWQDKPLKVSVSSLKRWLSSYRKDGFKGLYPKKRSDEGVSRSIDPLICKRILSIKEADPHLSIPKLIRELEERGESECNQLAKSSVHRFLAYHNKSGRSSSGSDPGKQRLPFRFPFPMDMWVGDVMHSRHKVCGQKVYLISFMDNATRAIMHSAYDISESALNILGVFKEALLCRGICKRVYLDHGSGYVDNRFVRTCAHVGIHLLYAPVRDGAAKGCIERWHRTVREDFEYYLQPDDLLDVDKLNSLLWRWIHTMYHKTPHSALDGQSPWQRYLSLLPEIDHRRIDTGYDFDAVWRTRVSRTVNGDGTIKLKGMYFEVPPSITTNRVELRYMEESFPDDVQVWVGEELYGHANRVDLEKNASRRRWNPKRPESPPNPLKIDPLGKARRAYDHKPQKERNEK